MQCKFLTFMQTFSEAREYACLLLHTDRLMSLENSAYEKSQDLSILIMIEGYKIA